VRPRRAHARHGRGCLSDHGRPASVVSDNARIHKVEDAKRAPLRSSPSWTLRAATVVYPACRRSQTPSEEGQSDLDDSSAKQAEDARKRPNTTEHRHHLSVRLSVSDTRHA
jgi:hypothetical protein